MLITDDDIDVRAWSERYHGGQHTNGPDAGVVVLHKPSGVAIVVTQHRSQMKNKSEAFERLKRVLRDIGWPGQ
jgi:protein subunit release factor A